MGRTLCIRNIDPLVIQRLRSLCEKRYGTSHGYQGEIISRAVAAYLDSMEQQGALPAQSGHPDPRVAERIARIREHVVDSLGPDSNGQIPDRELIDCIKKSGLIDRRQVKRYFYRYLPDLGYITETKVPHLYQVEPKWVPSVQKTTTEPAEEPPKLVTEALA